MNELRGAARDPRGCAPPSAAAALALGTDRMRAAQRSRARRRFPGSDADLWGGRAWLGLRVGTAWRNAHRQGLNADRVLASGSPRQSAARGLSGAVCRS